ncbi:unnamed protein product [Sphagnum compactum]
MAVNPLVHHRHRHGKRGRGGGDLWEMSMDPFDISLRSVLDDDTPARWRTRDTRAILNTNVDWLETPEAHIFKVDLPGVAKNEIEVTIEDNRTLCISGERATEEVKEGDNWHVVECARGHFVRRFRLPKNADLERITAEVKNGVLTIIVPKIEPRRKQERRQIEVTGPVDQAASGTQEGASAPPTPKEPAKERPARQEETPGEAPAVVATAATVESGQ